MDLPKFLASMVDRHLVSRMSKNVKYQEPSVQPIFFTHLYEYTDQMDMHDFNTPDPPYYRPQTKFAKVMFSQLSVIMSTGGCLGPCPGGV